MTEDYREQITSIRDLEHIMFPVRRDGVMPYSSWDPERLLPRKKRYSQCWNVYFKMPHWELVKAAADSQGERLADYIYDAILNRIALDLGLEVQEAPRTVEEALALLSTVGVPRSTFVSPLDLEF